MPPCQLSPYNIMKNKEEEREWTMYNGRCVNPSWAKCSARGFYKSNQLTFAPFYYLYLNLPYKWRSIFSGVLHQHWSPSRCSLLDEQKKENKKVCWIDVLLLLQRWWRRGDVIDVVKRRRARRQLAAQPRLLRTVRPFLEWLCHFYGDCRKM